MIIEKIMSLCEPISGVLWVREPHINSANQIQHFKSRVTTGGLDTPNPRLATRDFKDLADYNKINQQKRILL